MRIAAGSLRFLNTAHRAERRRGDVMSRLSSGLRVQRAADDAAGKAIAEKLRTRIGSTEAARRNINSALGTVQVAENGVGQIIRTLEQGRSLAVAAASETSGDDARGIMQDQLSEMIGQISDVANTTVNTNEEIRLLAGGDIEVAFLIDTSASMRPNINALQAGVADFEEAITSKGYSVRFALVEYQISVDAQDGVNTLTTLEEDNFTSTLSGISVSPGRVDPYAAMLQSAGITAEPSSSGSDDVGFTGEAKERHIIVLTDTGRETDLLTSDDSQLAVAEALEDNQIYVHVIGESRFQSRYNTIINRTEGTWNELGSSGGSIPDALNGIADQITQVASFPSPLVYQIGPDNTDDHRISLQLPINATPQGLGLAGLSVETVSDAREALDAIDTALDFLSSQRARFGGYTRRLESALTSNLTSAQNMTASLSTIEDADMAAELVVSVQAQIQQAAATSGLKLLRESRRDEMTRLLG
jgi:flagellin